MPAQFTPFELGQMGEGRGIESSGTKGGKGERRQGGEHGTRTPGTRFKRVRPLVFRFQYKTGPGLAGLVKFQKEEFLNSSF